MDPLKSINDLPENALTRVFEALNMQDLKQCSLVNKFWRDQISTNVGFIVEVGRNRHHSTFVQKMYSFRRIKLISQIGIQSGRIYNLRKNDELLPFKHANLVKTLLFDGKISSGQWNILLKPLTHLSSLTVSQFALLDFQLKDQWLEFPNLRSLVVTGKPPMIRRHFIINHNSKYEFTNVRKNWKQMILNVVHLLHRVRTPRIQEIVLQKLRVQSSKQEDLVILYLCRFIIRNKATLKMLSVAIRQQNVTQLRPVNSRLEKSLDTELQQLEAGLHGLQLQSMFVQSTRPESTRTQQMLRLILESQVHNQLEHVVWKFHADAVVHGFVPELASRNHDALKTIEMSLCPQSESINCQVFTNCASLQYLTIIRGNQAAVDGNVGHPQTQLTQSQFLPTSLISIRISGLQVSNEDARLISELQLNVLEFQSIGDSNGFGLQINGLRNIFVRKNITLLYLCSSLNKENFKCDGLELLSIVGIMAEEAQGWYPGLILRLVGNNNYIPQMCAGSPYDGFYEYGNCPRSNYFKNLSLQFPLRRAEFSGRCLKQCGLISYFPFALLADNGDDENIDGNLLAQLVHLEVLSEEDLNDSDEEVDVNLEPEEQNGQNSDQSDEDGEPELAESASEGDTDSSSEDTEEASDSD